MGAHRAIHAGAQGRHGIEGLAAQRVVAVAVRAAVLVGHARLLAEGIVRVAHVVGGCRAGGSGGGVGIFYLREQIVGEDAAAWRRRRRRRRSSGWACRWASPPSWSGRCRRRHRCRSWSGWWSWSACRSYTRRSSWWCGREDRRHSSRQSHADRSCPARVPPHRSRCE